MSQNPSRQEHQFTAFSFMFALGVLFHQSILSDWRAVSHHILVSLAALWLLFRPRSVVLFLTLVLAHFVSFVIDLPFVVNHWMMVGLLDLGVGVCALGAMWRKRSWRITGGELFSELAPVMRWSVVIMYMFAALAKLNWDFFNPELSAAVSLYDGLAGKLKVLPTAEWVRPFAIWGTALLECSLPAMLLWKPTRLIGVFVAIGFHFAMGLAGFIPFSGFALAFLFLFLPEALLSRASSWQETTSFGRRATAIQRSLQSVWLPIIACCIWLLIACMRTYAWLPPAQVRIVVIRIGQLLFAFYYLGFTALLVSLLRQPVHASTADPNPTFRLAQPIYLLLPFALILNGLCPYLGLKTESSFAMYSNLQTEGQQWNHLFMPQTLRVFGWQDELVRVIESNDPELNRAAEEEILITWFEFHRKVSSTPGIEVRYEYLGEQKHITHTQHDPVLSRPPSVVLHKSLWFREVPRPDKNTIRH